LERAWLVHPSPRFFVSVASKGFSLPVSLLESTLLSGLASVDSNEVILGKWACERADGKETGDM
jgi:hypothetical protein